VVCHERGEPGSAQRLLRQIIDADPAHVKSLVLLGEIAQRDGRNYVAIKRLKRALAVAPCDAAVHDGLGIAHQALGQQAEAIANVTRAIACGLAGVEGLVKLSTNMAQSLSRLAVAWPRQLSPPARGLRIGATGQVTPTCASAARS